MPNKLPPLDETVLRMKREITTDIEEGVIPGWVADFSTLHDYVDANCYGGACEPDMWYEGCTADDEFINYWNRAQSAINVWLALGRPSSFEEQFAGRVMTRTDIIAAGLLAAGAIGGVALWVFAR